MHPRCDLRRLAIPQVRLGPSRRTRQIEVISRHPLVIRTPHFPKDEELGGVASLDRVVSRADGVLQETDFCIF